MDIPQQMLRAESLVEQFASLTAQQRCLLEAPQLDSEALSDSLTRRRVVLDDMQAVLVALGQSGIADADRQRLYLRLAEIQVMDNENLRLADAQSNALREQARQMTQTRKGISTYGRADLVGSGPAQFDKKS